MVFAIVIKIDTVEAFFYFIFYLYFYGSKAHGVA